MAAVSVEESSGGGSSSNLLQTFWGLSSLEEQERLQSARELLSTLRERQVNLVARGTVWDQSNHSPIV